VDWIFNCHVCSEKKKVKIMAIAFVDYTVKRLMEKGL
jgi:hypothetical protein